jgi:agmatine/peptidylarginine deiminase
MLKFKVLFVSLFVFASSIFVFANESNTQITAAAKAKARFSTFKKDDFIKLNKRNKRAQNEQKTKVEKANIFLKNSNIETKKAEINKNENQTLASTNVWVPGEFDESQAVLISWPSYAYDADGYPLEPFMNGYGWPYDGRDTLLKIEGYDTDLYDDSPYPILYKELVNAIQNEVKVWIRLTNIEDSVYIKSYMDFMGYPLTNYLFFNQPEGENSFWMRDCGPYGYYYGDQDSLGLIGALYYPGRPIDNDISKFLATKFGYQYTQSNVETEGGNFMTDGWGRAFWSTVIAENNADTYGRAYDYKAPMSLASVNAAMKSVFNLTNYSVLNKLVCDGGTGHIDLYLKLVDDETIIATKYPDYMNSGLFPDYKTANTNITTIKGLSSHYGRPYNVQNLELPTRDNGGQYENCDSLFYDARTYINGLSINKTFIMPIYSNDTLGNLLQDNLAIESMKQILPGYTIYPIDARALSTGGGEIHCITMQIPAENPLRIAHQRISGLTDLKSEWNLTATAKNRSGIKSSKLYWKKQNETTWKTVDMPSIGSDQFSGVIPGANLTLKDSINYYIEVQTNNGKTQSRPISAPKGFYTYYFTGISGIEDDFAEISNSIKIEPNPANEITNFKFNLASSGKYKITITNSLGERLFEIPENDYSIGANTIQINTNKYTSGMYYISLSNQMISKTIPMMVIK